VVLCEFFKEKKLVIYFVFTHTTKYGAGDIFGPKSEENNRRRPDGIIRSFKICMHHNILLG
jgi:hypothetical protein